MLMKPVQLPRKNRGQNVRFEPIWTAVISYIVCTSETILGLLKGVLRSPDDDRFRAKDADVQSINLNHLQTFIHVAEFGSFSQAALITRTSQSALSRSVRSLEIELHQTLLLRNGRGVCLTEAGRRLLSHGTRIMQLVSRVRDEVNGQGGQMSGRIVIGLPPSLSREVTLPLVDVFKRQLPSARLAVVEGLSSHLAEWIGSGRIDVGLLFNPQPQPRVETTPIFSEDLCLVTLASRQRRAKKPSASIRMSELSRFQLIMPESSHVIRNLVETQAALQGVKLNVAWEVSSVPSIIDLVCADYGHAVLTASAVAASGRARQLVARRIIDPCIATTLCTAVSTNKRSSALLKQMLQVLPELVLKRTRTMV